MWQHYFLRTSQEERVDLRQLCGAMELQTLLLLLATASVSLVATETTPGNQTTVLNTTARQVFDCEMNSTSPRPGQPQNLRITDNSTGIFISWQAPTENADLVQSYSIRYRNDSGWWTLNKEPIPLENSSYTYHVTDLLWGRTYYLRVLAHSGGGCVSSEEVSFTVRLKAIIGVVMAAFLLAIVVIILAVYVVKMRSKAKRHRLNNAHRTAGDRVAQS